MLTTIPFAGFYHSIHDDNIDREIGRLFDDDYCNTNYDLYSRAIDCINYRAIFNDYAETYTDVFADEFGITLKFESLNRPREYNFETDRIYCTLSRREARRLFKECDKNTLDTVARERHTSRSGFWSFYDPDFRNWGSIDTWDAHQIGTLIISTIGDTSDWETYSMDDFLSSGRFENLIFSTARDINKLNRLCNINDYLRKRAERGAS